MKRLSIPTETGNLLPVGWYMVEYQPPTNHIKDKEVKKNTMKTRLYKKISANKKDEFLKFLKDNKIRHINPIPITDDLPQICPDCKQEGTPIITKERRAKIGNRDFNGDLTEKAKPKEWLRYNHSNGKPCRIAKCIIVNNRHYFQLKESLDKNSLGYFSEEGRIRSKSL